MAREHSSTPVQDFAQISCQQVGKVLRAILAGSMFLFLAAVMNFLEKQSDAGKDWLGLSPDGIAAGIEASIVCGSLGLAVVAGKVIHIGPTLL
mmetsp:Transcript_49285/g.86769  ORF Transcript_49285/g.86769 Transcript_49285/m.86769 type:complete len:93 (+) Transcript_49285:39-317(+)